MARFKLRQGYTEKDLGRAVLAIAREYGQSGGKLGREQLERFQKALRDLIDPAFSGYIKPIYDTASEIHIVIPWVGETDYTGNDLADECMGSIVIRGCGS